MSVKESINPLDVSSNSSAERQEAMGRFLELSPTFRNVPEVLRMPPDQYAASVEPALIAEVHGALSNCGRLIPFRQRDEAGRLVTSYLGDIMSPEFLGAFDSPPVSIRFNPRAGMKWQEGRWVKQGGNG